MRIPEGENAIFAPTTLKMEGIGQAADGGVGISGAGGERQAIDSKALRQEKAG
jgi:hypothetical protein